VHKINATLNQALKNRKISGKVQAAGKELHGCKPEDVLRWTQRETEKWTRAIQSAKVSVD
jgi:hypothetical protein